MTEHNRLLRILLNIDNHRVVVVHRIIDALGTFLRQGDRRENLLHLLLHLVDIEVTYHNNSLKVRTIPFLVVVTEVLIGEVVDNIHRANGQTVFILRTFINLRHSLFHQSLNGHTCSAGAPFLMDNAAFLIYLLVFQQQIVAPVVQNQQTGVSNAFTLQRYGRNIVYRLVNRSIGIQIGTKLDTNRLTPRYDTQFFAFTREVLRSVKRHMLQKVSQSTLAGLLKDGANALGDIEISQSWLFGVMTEIVRHTILQFSCTNGFVLRQRLSHQAHRCCQEKCG